MTRLPAMNDVVEVIAGPYAGRRGRVIRRPMGRQALTTVLGDSGLAFDAPAACCRFVEGAAQNRHSPSGGRAAVARARAEGLMEE